MNRARLMFALATGVTVAAFASAQADPRLREVMFDPRAIITVPVKRGVVTHIVLAGDEAIAEVGSGLGGDCANADAVWCIAAQPGGRNLFVKPKSGAKAPNNLAVVTDRRTHAFRFVVLDESDTRAPVYRLEVKAKVEAAQAVLVAPSTIPLPDALAVPAPGELVAERMQTEPRVVNSAYSIAEGSESNDIVPSLVFDDGRFTYFRLPGNRELPAVFHVLGDGSEALVNTRMEGDLMVVDRVSRRLVLRAGSAVVGVWNDAFDLEGSPPKDGTAVPGVQRVLKVGKAEWVGKAERPERAASAKDGEVMNATDDRKANRHDESLDEGRVEGGLQPLPGEAGIPNVDGRVRQPLSKKGLLAVALLTASIITVAAFGIVKLTGFGKKADDAEDKLAGNRPSAATAEPRKLELPAPRPASPASAPVIPAIVPTPQELAEPIPVRRSGAAKPSAAPEDAPVMLVTSKPDRKPPPKGTGADAQGLEQGVPESPLEQTRHNLDAYQRQLQGLLENLTRTTTAAAGSAASNGGLASTTTSQSSPVTAPSSLFGGALQGSATPRATASTLGNRSLTLPKGTAFTCALKTKVISATSGLIGCQVQRNVYSDDGRVLLIERGSHLDGEYRSASLRPGTVRIPVLWTRIRTPLGVTVDIESPGTGQLGESGIDGYVDNRWFERIGAAMLLSLIDDSVKLVISEQTARNDAGNTGTTIVLPSTTANASKLAEKVLESTINIPPLIYRNQGGIVGIVVARDVDFSSVYELRPVGSAASGRKP